MEEKYNLITSKNKIIVWVVAIIFAVSINYFFNRDYLQVKMLGSWKVVNTMATSEPIEKVEVSLQNISFDGERVTRLKYGSRSTSRNFERKIVEGEAVYLFNLDSEAESEPELYDYLLMYDEKNPNNMELAIFDQGELKSMYVLSREQEVLGNE